VRIGFTGRNLWVLLLALLLATGCLIASSKANRETLDGTRIFFGDDNVDFPLHGNFSSVTGDDPEATPIARTANPFVPASPLLAHHISRAPPDSPPDAVMPDVLK
jgi:hypothetical protein